MKGFSPKERELKGDVIGAENVLFAGRRVRAAFSPDILQAGAVKELINHVTKEQISVYTVSLTE